MGLQVDGEPLVVDDVQVSWIMLDPYIRKTMRHVSSDDWAWYKESMTLPDTYGYYTLSVEYKRFGYAYVHHKELVTIRHLAHDEYDRFIPRAFPYYMTYFGMTASLILVCGVYLFQVKEKKE